MINRVGPDEIEGADVAEPVTNEALAKMISEHGRMARAHAASVDARLTAIESDIKKMGRLPELSATLETIADTWKLGDLGGRIVKRLAAVLAAIGAIWLFLEKVGLHWGAGK